MATFTGNDDRLLVQYVRSVVLEILETVAAADFLENGAGDAIMVKINNLLQQFSLTVEEVIPQVIIADYFGGVDEATALLRDAGANVPATLAITEDGLIAKPFQKVIHTSAVEELIDDTMLDLTAAIALASTSAGVAVHSAIEEVKADITKGMITGDARKTIQARVMKTFLDRGMTSFVTSDGRKLPLDFYAMTVTRTKSRNATVQGSRNRYVDSGQDLVQIMGNGDSCKECSRFNGMVVSLTGKTPGFPVVGGAIRLPPFHPNCRCNIRVIVKTFTSEEELAAFKERNAKFHPTKDMRTPAQKRSYENEQRLRRIANAEKKQFMRWQSAMGAEAPKTLGAFRRMKRQNTPRFQELQSAYRSMMMEGSRGGTE